MTLSTEEISAIIFYRKQRSYAALQEANDAIKDAHWNLAIQRLYYAVYYMASALLMKNKIPAQTYNGVVGQIGLHFVTTGKLSKENGRLYSRLLQSRITGDYNDFFDFTEEEVCSFVQPTRGLVKSLEELIDRG